MISIFNSRRKKFRNTPESFLTYSGGAIGDNFGSSVSLNTAGNTLAVGAYTDDVGANTDQGSCTIFTRSGSTWSQQAYLTYSGGGAGDYFGGSVSLSSDGNTLAVGARYDTVGSNNEQGSCTIFTRSGSTWSQQAYLTYSGGSTYDSFGYAVSLSNDGNTLAVGAPADDVGSNINQGSCTIFTRSGSTWSQQAYLTYSSGSAYDDFGYSVSLSSDGNIVAVGSPGDDGDKGSCTIFTRTGSTWTQQTNLMYSSGVTGDNFGWSVSLNADGNTLAVGALNDIVGVNANQGSCTIFTRSGSTWSQQAYLTDNGGAADDYFGSSVSLNSDGNTLAVGALYDTVGANIYQGSCIIFTRSGSTWSQQLYLTYSNGANFDGFGYSVSLNKDGNTVAVGALLRTVGANNNQGSCVVYYRR